MTLKKSLEIFGVKKWSLDNLDLESCFPSPLQTLHQVSAHAVTGVFTRRLEGYRYM